MLSESELANKVKAYDKNADEAALRRAYAFANKMHHEQKRESGEPYVIHPINVAETLINYHMDATSIIAALLHDTVEDTSTSLEEIRNIFGEDVAKLVDGVTKLTRIEWNSDKSKQAGNFQKLVLAMSQDIRVLLIKLADRLHNIALLAQELIFLNCLQRIHELDIGQTGRMTLGRTHGTKRRDA